VRVPLRLARATALRPRGFAAPRRCGHDHAARDEREQGEQARKPARKVSASAALPARAFWPRPVRLDEQE